MGDISPEWVEWNGGICPVPGTKVVEIRLRDGLYDRGHAVEFYWAHGDPDSDIISYREVRA